MVEERKSLMGRVHLLLCEIEQLSRHRASADSPAEMIAKIHNAHVLLRVASNRISLARDDLATARSSYALQVTRLWGIASTRKRLERLAKVLKGI